MKRLWDLSPPGAAGSPVFPGDAPFELHWAWTLGPECPVNVATLRMSPTPAPCRCPTALRRAGLPVGELALEPYLGRCRVIHAIGRKPLVRWSDLSHALQTCPACWCTHAQAPSGWDPDLAALAPEVIERLADAGVRLIGIDTASIDPASSKSLDSHQAIRRRDLRVLENLVLDEVDEGDYELTALPLRG